MNSRSKIDAPKFDIHSYIDVSNLGSTEFEITGMGIGDIFDLTTSTQYEIETTSYSKFLQRRKEDYARDGVEIIVIPLAKLPVGWKERERALGEWVIE